MMEANWVLDKGLMGGDWSWPESGKGKVALVLDGIANNNLPLKIYQWAQEEPDANWLYMGTPWEPVKACSPWLVHLKGPDDPILKMFMSNEADREAGYIVVHTGSKEELAESMRRLLQVERLSGVPELLRIGHPAIAQHVIGQQLLNNAVEHPFLALLVPDIVRGQWLCTYRMAKSDENLSRPVPLKVELDENLLNEFHRFNQRCFLLAFLQDAAQPVLDWLGPGSLSDHYHRLRSACFYAGNWSLATPRTRLLFIELLRLSGTRPWMGEELPSAAVKALDSSGSSTSRIDAAQQTVKHPVLPQSNIQG
ncbi:DUF4123 domain-containing protein [Marinobacter sp. 1Y8]